MLLLLKTLVQRIEVAPPQPENGPSGGANWLRGYKPFDYSPKRRRSKCDELLFLTA